MTQNPLPRTSPEAQGISAPAIAQFVARAEAAVHSLHSFMLLRHGAVVAEGWWHPYRPETPHKLFSLSKSFTSTAVGLAVGEGRLNVDDPVLKFFPVDGPRRVSANLAAMKVRHLLSMSTGHHLDTTDRAVGRRNPAKAFLALPVEHEPGTYFVYNSGASYMLSAIVQSLTGQTVLEYLTPRLLAPLGIEGATWESHPNGVNFGGWGLKIRTEDIARLGQLYLQKGQWNGRQLVPAEWVEAATARQVPNGDEPGSDWCQGYGYQFWRCRHNAYRGDGAFGQYCIVMPDQDAVLAITSGLSDMQPPLNVVWDTLLPAMGAGALPPDEAANRALAETVGNLRLRPPEGTAESPTAARVSGETFMFAPNAERIRSLKFEFGPKAGSLTYRLLGSAEQADPHSTGITGGLRRRGTHTLTFGYGQWVEGFDTASLPAPTRIAASGVWTSADSFALTVCACEAPFTATLTTRFAGSEMTWDSKVNVAFGPTERAPIVGAIERR